MNKYLPAPWWAEKREGRWQIQTAHRGPKSSFCIALLNQWTDGPAETARLMASAPDLLEALTMVRDADEDCKRDGLPTIPGMARAKIDAAIRKATEISERVTA